MTDFADPPRPLERHRAGRVSTLTPGHEAAIRLLDIVIALTAIILLSPLLGLLWVAVRYTSSGPALFRQQRVGRGKTTFTMLKLRTMYTGNNDKAHREYVRSLLSGEAQTAGERGLFKLDGDPRITPIGRWLRRTSLDELPQLFNVLRGDMSLVGPRPVLPWEAEMFSAPHQRRFDVKPGITGLWQVSGRSRLTMREALDLDAEYVRRRSLLLDITILARTVPALLKDGAA
jgi:lipopolysaccharide/colanic/teichoic acid biosynthesis glycosyltransferase